MEAPCLWERNSPQVHIIPLPHNPFPDLWHFFFILSFFFHWEDQSSLEPAWVRYLLYAEAFFPCLVFMHTDEAQFPPRLLMFYSISNSAPSTPPPSEFRHSNGFKWTHCESNKGALMALLFLRGCWLCSQSILFKRGLAENHCSIFLQFLTLSKETSLKPVPA